MYFVFRSLTPIWEEMLVLNEDVKYITAEGMNIIVLFEIIDFVSFEMASLQYKRLGQTGMASLSISILSMIIIVISFFCRVRRRLASNRVGIFKTGRFKRFV